MSGVVSTHVLINRILATPRAPCCWDTPAPPPPSAGLLQAQGCAARGLLTSAGAQQASIQPENVVYSGPSSPNPKRVTLRTLRQKYEAGETLTMVTAYDYPSAVHVRLALWLHAHVCVCVCVLEVEAMSSQGPVRAGR